MNYSMIQVFGHLEVYDEKGRFLFSADNHAEAMEELRSTLMYEDI